MNRLRNKVAVVTGTSPNIGGAIAAGLAAEGAKLVCTDLIDDVARECAATIEESGGEAISVCGDVTDPAHAVEVIERAVARFGRVDILVNNATAFNKKGLLTMSLQEYRSQLDIILTGAFLLTREAAKAMINVREGGSIINVLSTAAWQGEPGNIGYSTAKSGLINFTRSAAMELAAHGVRVNGFTPTATLRPCKDSDQPTPVNTAATVAYPMNYTGQMPLGRLPTPQDYVPAVVYLASDESAMVTGTNLTVDGGATAKYWPWTPTQPERE